MKYFGKTKEAENNATLLLGNIYRGPEKGSAALHLRNSKDDVPQTRVAFRIERIYCTRH